MTNFDGGNGVEWFWKNRHKTTIVIEPDMSYDPNNPRIWYVGDGGKDVDEASATLKFGLAECKDKK